MLEAGSLVRLLCLASPSFPTGGYAYSHGLEWAVEEGEVKDAAGLLAWLDIVLRAGSGRSDAILLRHAHRAAEDEDALACIAELAAAACASAERQLEALAQGAAFVQAARAWGGTLTDMAYPVAFGAFAARQGIAEDAACIGYLAGLTANLVSAGLRLVPLGQADGLRVTAALHAVLLRVVDDTRAATLDDIGGACFGCDIASMLHETQYSRMFRS